MKIKPIFTEKSMQKAKNGIYSFWVLPTLAKNQIRKLIEEAFEVKVGSVNTQNYKKMVSRSMRGKTVTKSAKKKAMVTLKLGKIDIFEEPKK
jgi:ribosomal protein L23